ncbi:tyrosyl-tRNA synthetase [Xylariomycetidae sp. FL2044]|nr:tyrosyl-tRNA synthetase [Xylariomycetidae sp. FL2044]
MAATTFSSRAANARLTLCRTCLHRSLTRNRQPNRHITQNHTKKMQAGEEAWNARAELIKRGDVPHLWDILKERGFVKDTAGTDEQISELMRRKRIGAYVGIDPTSSSLHLGHLVALMPLYWMYLHGYKAVTVVGGATAKIGDPSGRLTSREDLSSATRAANTTKMHYQVRRIWRNVEDKAREHGYEKDAMWSRATWINSQWYSSLRFTDIVSRLFVHMRLGPMLSRDTVKRKMKEGDGMSLAEFIYPFMQAWDWWHLFSSPRPCEMQIGGSDQYGNIVAGVDAIKKIRDNEPDPQKKIPDDWAHTPVGFTVPLLTDSSGNKFGKSAGNAVWLDPFMTSPSDLYGYLLRRPDDQIEQLLKLLTFLPMQTIQGHMDAHKQDPSKRRPHHALALEVVGLAHGLKEAQAVQEHHRQLFGKADDAATTSAGGWDRAVPIYPDINKAQAADLAPRFRIDIQLPEKLILGSSLARIVRSAGFANSATEANKLLKQQGIYVGGAPGRKSAIQPGMQPGHLTFTPAKAWFPEDTRNFLIDGKILILRRGKHFVRVIEMVSNKEWEASGKSYPGEPGSGHARKLRERLSEAIEQGDVKEEEKATKSLIFPVKMSRMRRLLAKRTNKLVLRATKRRSLNKEQGDRRDEGESNLALIHEKRQDWTPPYWGTQRLGGNFWY